MTQTGEPLRFLSLRQQVEWDSGKLLPRTREIVLDGARGIASTSTGPSCSGRDSTNRVK